MEEEGDGDGSVKSVECPDPEDEESMIKPEEVRQVDIKDGNAKSSAVPAVTEEFIESETIIKSKVSAVSSDMSFESHESGTALMFEGDGLRDSRDDAEGENRVQVQDMDVSTQYSLTSWRCNTCKTVLLRDDDDIMDTLHCFHCQTEVPVADVHWQRCPSKFVLTIWRCNTCQSLLLRDSSDALRCFHSWTTVLDEDVHWQRWQAVW